MIQTFNKKIEGASLVVQWLTLHPQCRGLRPHPWSGTRSREPRLKTQCSPINTFKK